jgi:serine/threonine-protein kinase
VVHVYDHGTWNRTPFIAMEFLRGESLAVRLETQGRLDYARTQRLIAHAARALTRAHAIGVVHRDLKPENILFVQDDDGETAKLLDFGVAKWTNEWAVNNLTKAGLLVGTPLYMSPEQARGTKEIDGRSDLWSLAVIAYQCLTGDLPFISDGLGELLGKIMFDPIPVPSQVLPTLPPEVDAWWLKAAARNPASRFQTAKELSDALAVALNLERPTVVATAPVGLRPMAMSDDGLSVSGPGYESRAGFGARSTAGRNAKLVALGLVGVVAMTMLALFGKSTAEMKAPSTSIAGTSGLPAPTPSAAPAPPADTPVVQAATPSATAREPAAATSHTASPPHEAPKSESRRSRAPASEPRRPSTDTSRPSALPPEPVERKPASPPPPKTDSPAADFGI